MILEFFSRPSIPAAPSPPDPDTSPPSPPPWPDLPSFHLFASLPPELRLRIWELACHHRRTVNCFPGVDLFLLPPQPPSVLHACTESRGVGLRFYRRGLIEQAPRVYFKPDTDQLHRVPQRVAAAMRRRNVDDAEKIALRRRGCTCGLTVEVRIRDSS